MASFCGEGDYSGADIFNHVRGTMLVTVFVFIGIEGASVSSRYAKRREHVGWAIVMGFIGVLCLPVLVTLLPFGVLLRPELAGLRQPSMAGALAAVGVGFEQADACVRRRTSASIGLLTLAALSAWLMLTGGLS